MRVLSLFDGIGIGRQALKDLRVPVTSYHASEICPHAIRVCRSNHDDVTHVGDVRQLTADALPETIDLLLGAPPCQGLSVAGRRRGLQDDRSSLFWEFVRLFRAVKPKWWLVENVRMSEQARATISEALGVPPLRLNSRLVSCQNRPRLYWTNIPQTPVVDRGITLTSVIGPYDHLHLFPRGWGGGATRYRGDKAPCVTASGWERNFFVVQRGVRRRFTPEEAEAFQTMPGGYTRAAPTRTWRYKLVGNAWTVNAIVELLRPVAAP